MSKPISVPNYAPVILQPRLPHVPDLKILRRLADKETESKEVYSVTFSPVLCPVDKRHLYSLKPYFWEVEPGKWVRRDGERNPYCDLPQGQTQLQKMAQAVHVLSLGMAHLVNQKELYKGRLETLLRSFFVDDETRIIPQVEYAQCDPSVTPLKGSLHFIIAVRYLVLVTQSLALVKLDPRLDTQLRAWFKAHIDWMEKSEQGRQAQTYGNDGRGNNVAAWYHAALFTHLAFLDPQTATSRASLYFAGHVQTFPPAEYFAGELARTRPRHYTLFMLEPTFIIADWTASRGSAPGDAVLRALRTLLDFARTVKGGDIEVEVDNGMRYAAKLAWFEKFLTTWSGQPKSGELDGSGWKGGWNQYAKLLWSGL